MLGFFSTKSVELNSANKKALDNYKYQGGDNGISYRYFHSPFAEFLTSFLPKTIAPNVITLAGALCLVISHLVELALYGRAFDGPFSSYVAVSVGFAHMAYITLDNMDGKQARRTGTSSPLGQMFDHGCDAITFSLGVMTVCRFRQISSGYLALSFLCLSPTGYFMYNLKEYYLGEYYLPVFNPVSEGCLIDFFFNLFWAYLGWEAVAQPYLFGYGIGQLFAIILVIFQIYQNIEMFIEIYTQVEDKKTLLIRCTSYFSILILVFVIAAISPNDMVNDRIDGGRSIAYIIMFGSSYLVLHLILGHLSEKEFEPYKTVPFLVTLFALFSYVIWWFVNTEFLKSYEVYILYSIAAYLLINSVLIFTSIVKQMEEHFGIKAFSIKPKTKST